MDSDPPIAIAAVPMTIVSKLEHGDLSVTDVQRCLALPLSSEVFTLNASSPNSASSTTSSSMAERFTSNGLIRHSSTLSENDGGDSTSAISTTARHDHEHPLDCGRTSSASNVPSPIIEEGPDMTTNEGGADHISEDIDVDVKPSLDEACLSDTCRQDSSSDDMFMSRLDELLQSDTSQDFVAESGLAGVDDLFPSLNSIGQDFSLLDGMNGWSTESLEALPFPEQEVVQAESLSFDGDESAAQMFTQWLRNNAHWISLSDLRKIKLKTSTIENATRRLGGGKKGLMLFLKLVLLWVQNSQMKRVTLAERPQPNAFLSSAMQSRPSTAPGHPGTSAMPMEGISVRDGPSPFDSSSAMQSHSVPVRTPSEYGSPLPHVAVNSSSSDWASRTRWAQSPPGEHNATVPTSSRFSPTTNGKAGSPLPSTTFGHSNNAWPIPGNMLHGAPPSAMPPSMRSPASGSSACIGGGGMGDPASMMRLMQQQQCSEASPAAITRAARKSRMERQRWSVRRNRKWAVAAHQSQQRLAAAVPNGGMHTNLAAWPQAVGGSAPSNLPYPNSRACQQRTNSRPAAVECQQIKKPERNLRLLFHKELKQSDVGNLGRIVLPKAAETCLPPLDLRDGVNLHVEDMNSAKVWNMRYRFWPNNKSRMYLLENTGDFVKSYNLKEGDYMMLFRDNLTNRFVIRGAKGSGQAGATLNGTTTGTENGSDASGVWSGAKKRKSLSKEDADLVLMVPTNPEESCDDSSFAELIEQALEDFKEPLEAEMCDPPLKPLV